jgi:farnesyl-diphosphate farnesyltransferase
LPRSLREPIGLAYLLARATDTVADTPLIPRAERLRHLETLRRVFTGESTDTAAVSAACATDQVDLTERSLLERVGEAVERVEALSAADRRQVRRVLATITAGQIFDLERFPSEDAAGLTALSSREELDRYTYLVAGCVGEFWTALHVAHRPALAGWDLAHMSAQGIRFGKALQMTNVLRDVPRDLRSGRCYLPADELAARGLAPRDLLDAERTRAARPLFENLLAMTLEHYDVAWRYTLAIPRREWRMRFACTWPLMIGLRTLAVLAAHSDPLAVATPVKISRTVVRRVLAGSALMVWSNRALVTEAAQLRRRARRT